MQITSKDLEPKSYYIFSKEEFINLKTLGNLANAKILQPNLNPPRAKPLLTRAASKGSLKEPIILLGGGLYDGEIQNNVPHGFGKVTFPNKCIYIGHWNCGKRCGLGTTLRSDGSMNYDGEWKEDKPWGFGTAYKKDGTVIYKGEWENGSPVPINY